jgi:hypothetical protein
MNDTRILREREAASRAAAFRASPFAEEGAVAVLAQTTAVASYPIAAGVFYACMPLYVDGKETEGSPASFTADPTCTFYALNLGSQVPPPGTKIIAHACGGRWTFRYDG